MRVSRSADGRPALGAATTGAAASAADRSPLAFRPLGFGVAVPSASGVFLVVVFLAVTPTEYQSQPNAARRIDWHPHRRFPTPLQVLLKQELSSITTTQTNPLYSPGPRVILRSTAASPRPHRGLQRGEPHVHRFNRFRGQSCCCADFPQRPVRAAPHPRRRSRAPC